VTSGHRGPALRRIQPDLLPALGRMWPRDFTDLTRYRRQHYLARGAGNAGPQAAAGLRIVNWEPGVLGDVAVRQYRCGHATGSRSALVWAHGGGHVSGTIDQDDAMLQQLCASVGCDVFAVALRRAPEHPFPAPLEDVYSSLAAIHRSAPDLGLDRGRIAIGGASSGGGTAAGTALLARDRGELDICFQLLVYPMLDDTNVDPAAADIDPRLWSHSDNRFGWRSYLGEDFGTDNVSAYAAPLRAADLGGLPPAFIAVGDADIFLAEDLEYAVALHRQQVATEVHVYPGAYHGFNVAAPDASVTRRFYRDRDEALSAALETPAEP
jgi:acetyl esterase/lipase